MRVLIILISSFFISSCSSNSQVTFKSHKISNELDSFLEENKQNNEKVIHLTIADESDIFEDVVANNEEDIYLSFYYSAPEGCLGFYKSFKYRGRLILLYDFSERIKFSDIIEIHKESVKCNDSLLLHGQMDVPPKKNYYFKNRDKDKLIEIQADGALRTVE